jgi:hypothetical protein
MAMIVDLNGAVSRMQRLHCNSDVKAVIRGGLTKEINKGL